MNASGVSEQVANVQTSGTGADCDVLVLGSGCAALTAALHAAASGLKVLVCEKTALLGGASAMSAGGIWVPANHLARAAGIADDVEDAIGYIASVSPDHIREPEQWRNMVLAGPPMLRMIEERTPLRFRLTGEPDPYAAHPGARAVGRMVSPRPISRLAARHLAFRVRGSTLPEVFTYHEVLETDLYHKPVSTTMKLLPRLLPRLLTLSAGKGTALMIGLVRGCLDHGCRFELNARGVELIEEGGRVTGAIIDGPAGRRPVRAARATLIATGGFEWNADMMARHLPGPLQFFGPPRGNAGDGHRMAEAIGVELARMDEANVTAAIPKRYHGAVHGMPVPYHAEPNAIVVNREGRRFVDELAMNIGECLNEYDADGRPRHLPAHVITDATYLSIAPLVRHFARLVPGWMVKARTIEELAGKIGLDPATLKATVERYNALCAGGVDLDFGRGQTRAHQKADKRKRLGLSPIVKAPFIALRFDRSIMTTKGGPRTNAFGQALRADGSVVEGLYCAGASMANPIGTRGVGAGTTLGPFMSWGYVCAHHVVTGAGPEGA